MSISSDFLFSLAVQYHQVSLIADRVGDRPKKQRTAGWLIGGHFDVLPGVNWTVSGLCLMNIVAQNFVKLNCEGLMCMLRYSGCAGADTWRTFPTNSGRVFTSRLVIGHQYNWSGSSTLHVSVDDTHAHRVLFLCFAFLMVSSGGL